LGAFFDIIHQDPLLSQVKLIAEPWDLGEGGYQVGNFPVLWTEWNGKYRDTVRRFWRGDGDAVSEFATRLCGSSDLYEQSGRKPYASINFVTSHDGFCLRDLVSYNEKHNAANGDENQDGDNHNLSWNSGVEGDTTDPHITALRRRQLRNFFATLMLSQGVPMIRSGDEFGHTQLGNNNAYCQDNAINWLNWELEPWQTQLLTFVGKMTRFRAGNPVLQRRQFFQGREICGATARDITWLTREGKPMCDTDWRTVRARVLAVCLNGHIDEVDERGQPIAGATLLVLFNAEDQPVSFHLPELERHLYWKPVIDTARHDQRLHHRGGGSPYEVVDRSCVVFELKRHLLRRIRPPWTFRGPTSFSGATDSAAAPPAERRVPG
ncbi:MAG: hypothetical protein ACYC6N_31385, partial [Pirellulaceae bacterium]